MASRLAYLEALGLTAWERRDGTRSAERVGTVADPATASRPEQPPPPAAPAARSPSESREPRARVVLGPGKGGCLFLCGREDDSTTALAADLARAVRDMPVWGHVDERGGGQLLEAAIAERLFTQVVVFGEGLARLVFGGEVPGDAGPAKVTVVDDLARLARDPGARRACWSAFRAAGLPAST